MKDSELQFDRTCHVLYSKPCKKEILAKIALHYPEAEREAVWEKVQRQYVAFLSDWRTDLGGKKNFHNGAGGTYDCIAILSYYAACKAVTSFREIEEMEENLVLPSFRKLKFVDGNNMANSLIVGGLKVGMEVSIACPEGYHPDPQVLEFAKAYGDKFTLTDQPLEAAKDADVVITDVWASMGQEGEAEKRKVAFNGYQINDDVMAQAHADAMVLHCLPAHREEEITEKVFEAHADEIFEEAENRLHAQKAVMVKLMK